MNRAPGGIRGGGGQLFRAGNDAVKIARDAPDGALNRIHPGLTAPDCSSLSPSLGYGSAQSGCSEQDRCALFPESPPLHVLPVSSGPVSSLMAAAPFLFFLFATVAVAAALGMLLARSPVTSALWLVLNMFCLAGLYLTMNATFIGVIQILVYAGAIMVLFLFVIMLLNLAALPALESVNWKQVAAFVLGMVLLAQLLYVVAVGFEVPLVGATPTATAATGDAKFLARPLLTTYALHVEVTGLLLLAATIGAVMLAQRRFE